MNTKLISLTLIACALLASCASSSNTDASGSADAAIPSDKGRIVFYRPGGIYGLAQRAAILLDGQKVGTSTPGAKFHVDAMPGAHIITVPNILYPGENRLELTVAGGEASYVKTSIGGSAYAGRTNIDLVPAAQGAQESAKLKSR